MVVQSVAPDSIAARAGLEAGDRIVRANGQTVEGRTDWQRVHVHLGRALPLGLESRAAWRSQHCHPPGRSRQCHRSGSSTTWPVCLSPRASRHARLCHHGRPAPAFAAIRAARSTAARLDRDDLAGAPMRLAEFWEQLPALPALLFWLPFATSVAVGPLLFAFFAVFPRRTLSLATLACCCCRAWSRWAGTCVRGYVILAPAGAATGFPTGPAGCSSSTCLLARHHCRRSYAIRPASTRDGPPPRTRAAGGHDRRRRGRRRRGRPLLVGSLGRYLRHAHPHGAVAGVPGRAGVLRLRHPASPPVRPQPHRAAGRCATRWPAASSTQ